MDFKELKNKSDNELKNILTEEREKLTEMRFKVAQRQLKKVSNIRNAKKTIARILTLLSSKREKGG